MPIKKSIKAKDIYFQNKILIIVHRHFRFLMLSRNVFVRQELSVSFGRFKDTIFEYYEEVLSVLFLMRI